MGLPERQVWRGVAQVGLVRREAGRCHAKQLLLLLLLGNQVWNGCRGRENWLGKLDSFLFILCFLLENDS